MKKITARWQPNQTQTVAGRTMAPLNQAALANIRGGSDDEPVVADQKHIGGVKYEG